GFKCNVGGDCAGNTNSTLATNFEWNLTVPWTSTPTQMCLRGTSTADTRVVFVTPTSADENRHGENVAFQPADVCQIYAPGQHYFVNFTPYRAAGAFLQGSVQAAAPLSVDPDVDPDGLQPSAVGGPVLSARAERFEACGIVPTGLTVADVDPSAQLPCASTFECDPIAPNATPGVGFPDCDTGAVDEDGLFSLTLPAMGVNSTWAVSATAPGYYVETYTRWPAVLPITPTFLLYPRAFDAVIRIIDLQNGVAHDCDTEDEDFPLTLGLRDLQDQNGDVNIDTWTATAPITVQEDHSCIAVVHVGDWHRDPQPVPALVGSSWPKTAEPFLVRPQQSGHAGAVVASLGPLGSDRFTNVTMVHGASAPRVPADQVGAIADCIQLDLTPEREPARTICAEFRALNAIATRLVETLTDGPGGVLPIVTGAGDAAAEIAACVQADETPTDDNAAAICEQWRAANDAVADPPSADDAPDAQENATAIQACVQANATPSQAPATTVCDAFRTVRSGPLAVANEIVACINEDQTPKDANAAAVCDLFRAVAGSAPEVVTPFTITGRVFDGDAIATTNAQLGVPSTVTATPAAGSSCTEVVTANTMPNGSYSLGIPCAGAYTVMAKPLDQLATHWSANTTSTTVSAAAPTATKDVPLERKDVTITVTVRRPPTTAVSGVTVTPVGVDVIGTHASKVSNGGILQWTLPWGVYTLNASNHGAAPSTPIVPMPGQPQTWSATVWAPA
ncbi:MAG TPA: hypothetical protein VM370_11900, partial [Candidatus Thermoplasmatota archaeon]|nr:hypothetical protein [Candidatus Thermoplasmatota archaeon]